MGDNELERVRAAIDARVGGLFKGQTRINFVAELADAAIAATTTPQVVETVEELEALHPSAPLIAGKFQRLTYAGVLLADVRARCQNDQCFPATVLYPHPTPGVLHIAGPCEDGETVTVLCGVVKEAESPKSPDQPVCQACSAVQMAERNELNYARESASDVLAEVRAVAKQYADASASLGGAINAGMLEILALIDREAGR